MRGRPRSATPWRCRVFSPFSGGLSTSPHPLPYNGLDAHPLGHGTTLNSLQIRAHNNKNVTQLRGPPHIHPDLKNPLPPTPPTTHILPKPHQNPSHYLVPQPPQPHHPAPSPYP